VSGYTYAELQNLPMSDFGQLRVSFGKTNKGRTFEDAMISDPGWVKWCGEHLATSQKEEHKAFLLYVSRATTEVEELERQLLQPEPGEDSPIVIPLRSAPSARVSVSADPTDPRVDELRTEVSVLQQRVLHLETAMDRLVEQVLRMQH
jgi:hypothetical protein